MANNTGLDGRGLFIVNLGGGVVLTVLAYFASTLELTGGGNLGLGIMWMLALPVLVVVFAFLLWLLQAILFWTWRSSHDKRVLVLGIVLCSLVLLSSYLIEISMGHIWESTWSLVISAAMLLWAWIIVAMRMQLWREEQAMIVEKYKR